MDLSLRASDGGCFCSNNGWKEEGRQAKRAVWRRARWKGSLAGHCDLPCPAKPPAATVPIRLARRALPHFLSPHPAHVKQCVISFLTRLPPGELLLRRCETLQDVPDRNAYHVCSPAPANMIDPLRAWAPESLQARTADLANTLHLSALPLHLHEVLLALSFYACVAHVLSPILSARIVPDIYAKLDRSGRINWGVHIVSFVQSIIVNALSLYIIFCDDERVAWRPDDQWPMRVWGYHGLSGLLQSLALGYFLFDLYMCIRHVGIFGWGMVVHALASSSMFILGFVRLFTAVDMVQGTDGLDSGHSSISTAQSSSSTSCRVLFSISTGSATSWVSRDHSSKLSTVSS